MFLCVFFCLCKRLTLFQTIFLVHFFFSNLSNGFYRFCVQGRLSHSRPLLAHTKILFCACVPPGTFCTFNVFPSFFLRFFILVEVRVFESRLPSQKFSFESIFGHCVGPSERCQHPSFFFLVFVLLRFVCSMGVVTGGGGVESIIVAFCSVFFSPRFSSTRNGVHKKEACLPRRSVFLNR